MPGKGLGVHIINRVADGALPQSFLIVIPGRVGVNLLFRNNECVRDSPEIFENSRIGCMDTVTRADKEDVFLRIHG